MNSFDVHIEQIHNFIFLLTRCSGLFIFTPFLGNFLVPLPARILLSFALSYLFSLSAPMMIKAPLTMSALLPGLAGEFAVGMVIGFAAHTVFAGLQYAGHLISLQIGLSFVNTVDPQTSNRSTTFSIYENFLGMMLFLGFNGHHWFIEAIGKSLSLLPPYSMRFGGEFITQTIVLLGRVFVIGFQVSAPVVAILILTDTVLGLIGRNAPQIHIWIIGAPIKVLVGLSAMGFTLYFLPMAMRGFSAQLYRELNVLLHLMRA